MRKYLTLLALIVLFNAACSDESDGVGQGAGNGMVQVDSYAQAYVLLEDIEIIQYEGNIFHLYPVFSQYPSLNNYYSYDYNDDIYENICLKHGDHGYSRQILLPGQMKLFVTPNLISMDVYSDQQWDMFTTEGASLADKVTVTYVSPYQYVQSRYEDVFDWANYGRRRDFQKLFPNINFSLSEEDENYERDLGSLFPGQGLMSKLGLDELTMVGSGILSSLEERTHPWMVLQVTVPSYAGVFDLTFTFATEDKRYITKKVKLNNL